MDVAILCPEPVIAELDRLRNTSIFFVQTKELEKKLQASLPEIQRIVFTKRPPNRMEVQIETYPPAFHILSGQYYMMANENGEIIAQTTILPQGEYQLTIQDASLQIGNQVDKKTFSILLNLVEELKKTSIPVLSIEYIDETQIMLKLVNNKTAILKKDDIFSQLTTLQRILNDATMSERGHTFDVRFAHPVVKN